MNNKRGYGQYDKVFTVKLNDALLKVIAQYARERNISHGEAIRLMILEHKSDVLLLDNDNAAQLSQTVDEVDASLENLQSQMNALKRHMKRIVKSFPPDDFNSNDKSGILSPEDDTDTGLFSSESDSDNSAVETEASFQESDSDGDRADNELIHQPVSDVTTDNNIIEADFYFM